MHKAYLTTWNLYFKAVFKYPALNFLRKTVALRKQSHQHTCKNLFPKIILKTYLGLMFLSVNQFPWQKEIHNMNT